jgi:outer membrane scaffolding protein for murein synthesis (MipA/OmpV family)
VTVAGCPAPVEQVAHRTRRPEGRGPSPRLRRAGVSARLGLAALALVMGATARAQPTEPGPDVDVGLNPGTQRPLWELGIGVGGLRLPDYAGSDQNRWYVLPWPYLVYRGSWFKADRDGARAVLFDSSVVNVDVSAAASPPSNSSQDDARSGMPNLPGTLELGPSMNVRLARSTPQHWRLELRLPLRAAVTLQRSPQFVGTTFSPHLNLDIGGGQGRWNVGLLTGPQFADRRYNALYYSVAPADATAGRPAYRAGGGYSGWLSVASTSVRWGPTWIGAFVRDDRLQGTAFEDSPLVRRRTALTFGFGISWILATSAELVASSD